MYVCNVCMYVCMYVLCVTACIQYTPNNYQGCFASNTSLVNMFHSLSLHAIKRDVNQKKQNQEKAQGREIRKSESKKKKQTDESGNKGSQQAGI